MDWQRVRLKGLKEVSIGRKERDANTLVGEAVSTDLADLGELATRAKVQDEPATQTLLHAQSKTAGRSGRIGGQ